MRRSRRLLAFGSVAAFAIAFPGAAVHGQRAMAATASPQALHTLTISEIDRDGTSITPSATVFGDHGHVFLSNVHVTHVPTGTYVVAARIWRTIDGDTQTVVAKSVHITGNTHVTLDAQGAVAVVATTTAPGVTQGDQTVEVCAGHGTSIQPLAGFLVDSAGTVYVKPMSASGVETVYQTFWQNGLNPVYDLAGAFTGGIPAHPVYSAQPTSMAKVNVELNADENVTPLAIMDVSYNECGTSQEPIPSTPWSYVDYRTPGNWTTNLNFGSLPSHVERDLFKTATYQAGHTYADQFGDAVYGPGKVFPVMSGSHVTYSPSNLFDDPVVRTGFNCEGKASVQLKHGATLVKKQKMTFCGKANVFSAHPGAAGWYNMSATAMRWNPIGSLPPLQLSAKLSVNWHFRYAPVTGHPVNAEAAPVTVTVFHPQGLHSNEAGPGTTTVKFNILRGGGEPVATPVFPLHTVKLQYSYDTLTWHTATVTKQGSFWEAKVPIGAGLYVSLRTIVTDTHGDSTTETIDFAYLEV
jgi:hypothetical protein